MKGAAVTVGEITQRFYAWVPGFVEAAFDSAWKTAVEATQLEAVRKEKS